MTTTQTDKEEHMYDSTTGRIVTPLTIEEQWRYIEDYELPMYDIEYGTIRLVEQSGQSHLEWTGVRHLPHERR